MPNQRIYLATSATTYTRSDGQFHPAIQTSDTAELFRKAANAIADQWNIVPD